jgi:putative ABC transport system permease protein
LSLLTLPQRKGSSLVIVACMACVVGVLLSVLSVTVGMLRTYAVAGSPDRAIVFSRDALSFGGRMEDGSTIPPNAIATLVGAPGIARDANGEPMMDGEVLAFLPPTEGFAQGSLLLRGVGLKGLEMQPGFRLVAGRLFRPGIHELIVGSGARAGASA